MEHPFSYMELGEKISKYFKNQICKNQKSPAYLQFAILKLKFKNSYLKFEICNFFCNFVTRKENANIVIMEENFATRLKLFMESINVQSSQFADMCDIPRPSFSQLLSGRNQKVSDTLIRKIHSAYPELSVMWLMFGEGPMLSIQDKNSSDANVKEKSAKEGTLFQDVSDNVKEDPEFSKLNALNQAQNSSKNNIYQQLEDNKKILELQLQIEKLQKNPRRVAQITVYYDDSTFETFVPSKNK